MLPTSATFKKTAQTKQSPNLATLRERENFWLLTDDMKQSDKD
jgi:hypothetical protein